MFFPKKEIKTNTSAIIFFLLAAVLIVGFFIFKMKEIQREVSQNFLAQISVPAEKQNNSLVLMFVGDVMLDRGVEWAVNKYGQGDWKFPFLKIASNLKEADILFGNLEGPISDKGTKVGSIYSFRADPKAIEGLKFAGFDVLSLANNHIFDYGREAMEDTFNRLKTNGIDYVGGGFSEEEARGPIIKHIKGIKIAFLSYTNLGSESWAAQEKRSGIAWLTEENIKEDVKKASNRADLVIVSFHFGDEYKTQSNLEQKYFAHLAVDYGADLVVSHHPHVVQEIEKYPAPVPTESGRYGAGKNSYIAYSLGNFVFDQGFSEETMRGLLLKVVVKEGEIKETIPVAIRLNEYFQPEILF